MAMTIGLLVWHRHKFYLDALRQQCLTTQPHAGKVESTADDDQGLDLWTRSWTTGGFQTVPHSLEVRDQVGSYSELKHTVYGCFARPIQRSPRSYLMVRSQHFP